jgi:thiamine kinase-like enzyme
LTIAEVIARMGWADAPDLTVVPLPRGITNHNYRVDAGGESFVVRIPGRGTEQLGIDRRREHACARVASASGVAPPVAAFLEDAGVLVTGYVLGREPGKEEMSQPQTLGRVAAALRRYHAGPAFPGTFSPFRAVREYLAASGPRDAPLPARFGWMMAQAERVEAALGAPQVMRPCHNDLLPANFLDDGERLWILDWEYAAMGDIFFDLGNFAAHLQLPDAAESTFLHAYFGAVAPPTVARLKLMKIASDLREAMWAMVQVTSSALDYDFAGYGHTYFDRCAAGLQDPRVPAWLRDASAPE